MNFELLTSFLLATSGLSALLVVAISLGASGQACSAQRAPGLRRLLAITVLLQTFHVAEETVGGMHRLGPALLGLAPWPPWLFLGFNLAWISVWLLSLTMLDRSRLAVIAVWFLALASIANAVVHPALSIVTGGYFPGLVTSPMLGVMGYLLVRALSPATRGTSSRPAPVKASERP